MGGRGNICFGHVSFAVHQGQRRDSAATGEEQLERFTARKSKFIRLYLYSGKLILAATYLRRAFVDGHSLAAGAPALAHVCAAGAYGTKPRRGPPAALPGAGVWLNTRGHGAHCLPLFSAAPANNIFLLRVDSFGVDSRFEKARSSSDFNFFVLDSK